MTTRRAFLGALPFAALAVPVALAKEKHELSRVFKWDEGRSNSPEWQEACNWKECNWDDVKAGDIVLQLGERKPGTIEGMCVFQVKSIEPGTTGIITTDWIKDAMPYPVAPAPYSPLEPCSWRIYRPVTEEMTVRVLGFVNSVEFHGHAPKRLLCTGAHTTQGWYELQEPGAWGLIDAGHNCKLPLYPEADFNEVFK